MPRRHGYVTRQGAELDDRLGKQAAVYGLVDDDAGLMRSGEGPAPAWGFDSRVPRDQRLMLPSQGPETPLDQRLMMPSQGPEPAAPMHGVQQIQGFQGYLNNPLEDAGRERIAQQFMQAPLGGYVRDGLAGREVFGHTITNQQARTTEQVLAAAMATGIGVPTFLAGVQGLMGDQQTAGTIPMS